MYPRDTERPQVYVATRVRRARRLLPVAHGERPRISFPAEKKTVFFDRSLDGCFLKGTRRGRRINFSTDLRRLRKYPVALGKLFFGALLACVHFLFGKDTRDRKRWGVAPLPPVPLRARLARQRPKNRGPPKTTTSFFAAAQPSRAAFQRNYSLCAPPCATPCRLTVPGAAALPAQGSACSACSAAAGFGGEEEDTLLRAYPRWGWGYRNNWRNSIG